MGTASRYGDRHEVTAIPITRFCVSVLWRRYLQCPYFLPGGVSRRAGDEVEADISQAGGAEISDQRGQAPRLWASGNFGSGYAGLGNFRVKAEMTLRSLVKQFDSKSPERSGNL